MHNGFVVEIKELKPHTNADKLQLATFFGETVIVGLDTKIGDIGIYFPCDLQLSEEYCDINDLCRKKADGTAGNGYLEREKRNIKAISLRGEKSYGLYAPLKSLEYTGVNLDELNVGDTINIVNGHDICNKYIPRTNPRRGSAAAGNKTRKKKAAVAPLFTEHADTEQLAYNLGAFKPHDEIEITLKMHGTSGRTARLPVLKKYKRTLWEILTGKEGTPIYDDGYVSGTRRVVLENYEGGFYGDNSFREKHSKVFEGKLMKGETVYYEIVGFTDSGAPIMGDANNNKLNDKEFLKQYGATTRFSYGCEPKASTLWVPDGEGDMNLVGRIKQSDMYVYRMTMTNEDGFVVEYTPDFMRYRCEQMGVKTVPVLWRGTIPSEEIFTGVSCELTDPGEFVKDEAENQKLDYQVEIVRVGEETWQRLYAEGLKRNLLSYQEKTLLERAINTCRTGNLINMMNSRKIMAIKDKLEAEGIL